MPYIDLAGLSRYASRQKDYLEREYALLRDMQWTRSEKAGAVSLWPVGGTLLKPVVDFLFAETPPSSGDKGPSNPSTIAGVSSVKVGRCGANLFNVHGELVIPSSCTVAADDFLELSGTNSGSSITYANHTIAPSFSIQPDKTYTVVVEIQSVSNCAISFGVSSGYAQRGQLNTGSWVTYNSVGTFFRVCTDNNLYNPTCILRLTITCDANSTFSLKARVSVFEGIVDSSTFEYVPYAGTDYTLPLGSTYYGGTLDVASGVMTVTHRMFTITGTTAMSTTGYAEGTDAYRIGYYLPDKERTAAGSVVPPGYACDTLPIVMNPAPSGSLCWGLASASTACYIRFPKELIGAGDDLPLGTVRPLAQAWLAQHPVTVAYPMVETNYQTVQLSPTSISALAQTDKYTPRLNTVYTDASAVQVGYVKSPIRDEYELQQAVIAQGGNV